jgi:hypothetical protein
MEIDVLCLYKESVSEYMNDDFVIYESRIHFEKTKYTNMGPGTGNQNNCLFFSEGYNLIYNTFQGYDGTILMLAEDHFFTNGESLYELQAVQYDLAFKPWEDAYDGSLMAVNMQHCRKMFPIPETVTNGGIEGHLKAHFSQFNRRIHVLSKQGDGFYTNDYNKAKEALQKAGIIT